MAELALGTAQLGLKYGINNTTGYPNLLESFGILDMAIERGILSFDTAPAYGTAEDVLGGFVKSRNLNGKIDVTTKLRADFMEESQLSILEQVSLEVQLSLGRLKVDRIDGYLLHNAKQMYDSDIVEALYRAKEKKLIKRVGVSIYTEEDALYAVRSHLIDQIQIPYSILDQRLDQGAFFNLALEKKKVIHARSTFLQGLMFMSPENIPAHLAKARSLIERLNSLSDQFDISIYAMALLFSKANTGITHVVFGSDNCDQLAKNVEIFLGPELDPELVSVLRKEFRQVDPNILDPRQWSE